MNALLDLHHRIVRLPRTDRVARPLAELARPAATILDVGSGDGRVGARVAELLGATAHGVDVRTEATGLVPTTLFDGAHLPFPDRSFDAVVLSDVLHHADDPERLLAEALRVARRAAVVKDHFAFGRWSSRLLHALDRVGNAQQGVGVRGNYLTPRAWLDMVERAGGAVRAQIWPLQVHAGPIALFTRSELQFAARVERVREAA